MRTLARSAVVLLLACAAFFAGLHGGPLLGKAKLALFPSQEFAEGDYSALYQDANASVVLFSTSTCPYCTQVRALLDDAKVTYTDYLIDKSEAADAKFRSMDGVAVPLLFVGDRSIRGFRPESIQQALRRSGAIPNDGSA